MNPYSGYTSHRSSLTTLLFHTTEVQQQMLTADSLEEWCGQVLEYTNSRCWNTFNREQTVSGMRTQWPWSVCSSHWWEQHRRLFHMENQQIILLEETFKIIDTTVSLWNQVWNVEILEGKLFPGRKAGEQMQVERLRVLLCRRACYSL